MFSAQHATLLGKCLDQVAFLIESNNFFLVNRDVPSVVPTELCERLVERLATTNQLSDSSLARLLDPKMTILRMNNLSGTQKISPSMIEFAVERCPDLAVLECSGSGCLTERTLDLLSSAPRCDTIRSLNLSACGLNTEQARLILESCRYLQVLDISSNPIIDSSIFESSFHRTAFTASAIAQVVVADVGADGVTSHSTGQSRKRKRAQSGVEINLAQAQQTCLDCECGGNRDCPAESPAPKRRAPSRQPHDVSADESPSQPSCPYSQTIEKQFHLSRLNLSGCQYLSDAAVRCVAKHFPLLQEIDLSHCPLVTNINPLLEKCLFLTTLRISGCNVSSFACSSPRAGSMLEELHFSGNGCIDPSFEVLLTAAAPNLRFLELRNKLFEDQSLLPRVLPQLKSLTSLDLHGSDVDGSIVRSLVENENIRSSLQVLSLGGCDEISALDWIDSCSVLATRSRQFAALQTLSVSGLKHQLPIDAITTLGRACPSVVDLSIGSVADSIPLRQPELAQVLAVFPKLRTLNVWSCDSISMTLLALIPQRFCKSVETVNLSCLPVRHAGDPHNPVNDAHNNDAMSQAEPRVPILTPQQHSMLHRAFPRVTFRIWQHAVNGEFFYQEITGSSTRSNPAKTNTIRISVTRIEDQFGAGDNDEHLSDDLLTEIYCRIGVVVDEAPIWSNENSVSLDLLAKTLVPSSSAPIGCPSGGHLPFVRDWCCECNINDFNGVTYRADNQFVNWQIIEPGPAASYCFRREQYESAVVTAQSELAALLSQIKCERQVAQLQRQL